MAKQLLTASTTLIVGMSTLKRSCAAWERKSGGSERFCLRGVAAALRNLPAIVDEFAGVPVVDSLRTTHLLRRERRQVRRVAIVGNLVRALPARNSAGDGVEAEYPA